MEKLFIVPISREICRSRIILFGLILFLLLPCTLAAQDASDLKPKAEQGDAHSQVSLGLLYENGKGVAQDYKEAVKWYRKAAEQGNVQAQNNLGGMYYHGKGVTQDYNEAIKWSLKSLKTKPRFLITVLFPCLFGTMALFFLVIGLRGVVTKKPFLISARWLLFLIVLGFGPGILQAVSLPTSGDGSGILMALRWLVPTMLIVVVIFLSFTMRGYIAFGVTDASFRDGLLASLKKLNLAYEETLSAMRLPTIGADLQVAVQSWMGTGQIKMKQRQFRRVLVDTANNMNEYYQNSAVPKVNLTCLHILRCHGSVHDCIRGCVPVRFQQNSLTRPEVECLTSSKM